jgi:hypothetical protein
LKSGLNEGEASRVAAFFFNLFNTAELVAYPAASLLITQASAFQRRNPFLDMKPKLSLKIALQFVATPQA